MAIDPSDYNEIAARYDKLSAKERRELLDRLEQRHATTSSGEQSSRSMLDGFKQRGFIGSITDAPSDWSTNPKYMEGLGKDRD